MVWLSGVAGPVEGVAGKGELIVGVVTLDEEDDTISLITTKRKKKRRSSLNNEAHL